MSKGVSTAIVTGAAGGIGTAAVNRLAAAGWNVVAADRDANGLGWAEGIANVATVVGDVTSEEDNLHIVEMAKARFGGLDALIVNAAIACGGSFDDLPFEAFERAIAVNLFGAVRGIRAALPALRERGGGAIAVTSSTMGLAGDAENWAYVTSKHALIGLVRSLAREIGCQNIRINALCPGPTRGTGMTGAVEEAAPAHFEMLARNVPLQRWADPDEMAYVLEFLVSPASSYVNGHALVADGGALVGSGLLPPASGSGEVIPEAADWKEGTE